MGKQDSEQQVKELIESWTHAIKNDELEKVLENHAKDIVMFDVPAPLQARGIAAYQRTWELFFKYQHKGKFDLTELRIVASDTVAFCHALVTIGNETKPLIRLTMGFEKINGKWIISHEHHSAPWEG